jgi:hypothetical protein
MRPLVHRPSRGFDRLAHFRPLVAREIDGDVALAKFRVAAPSRHRPRPSRDQEHVAGLCKQLSFYVVLVLTIAEGEITKLHVGLKGAMNALHLTDPA